MEDCFIQAKITGVNFLALLRGSNQSKKENIPLIPFYLHHSSREQRQRHFEFVAESKKEQQFFHLTSCSKTFMVGSVLRKKSPSCILDIVTVANLTLRNI